MKILTFTFLIFIAFNFISCTGNDLFDDEVKLKNNSISGSVKLENQTDHSGIYVWFPLTDKGTYTDENGHFDYSLPSNFSRKGLEYFQYYFYLNDYILKKDSVKIRDGKFEYGTVNIDSKGNLNTNYLLNRLFSIEQITDNSLPKFTEIYPHFWYKIKFHKPGFVTVPISNSYQIGLPVYYETSSYIYFDNNSVSAINEKVREWSIFGSNSPNNEIFFMLNLSDLITNGTPYGVYNILLVIIGNEGGIPEELLNNIETDGDRRKITNYIKQPHRINKILYTFQPPS